MLARLVGVVAAAAFGSLGAALALWRKHEHRNKNTTGTTPLCAIGDTHADLHATVRALALCGAVETTKPLTWRGRNMVVVQTGDILDRGNASLPTLRYLWSLADQAATAGGELLLLMGNHELLNMQGRINYVHGYSRRAADSGELARSGGRDAWREMLHPARGEIGRQLANHPAVAVRGEGACRTLFVHAGVRASTARKYGSVDALNKAVREQLLAGDDTELLDAQHGPLWFRGYARSTAASRADSEVCAELAAALVAMGDGAQRMAVGHNIVPWVATRCGGMLHMLDVGMSAFYGGKPAAWRCSVERSRRGGGIDAAASIEALYEGGVGAVPDLCAACARLGVESLARDEDWADCAEYCGGKGSRV